MSIWTDRGWSLRVVDQLQNSLETGMRMCAASPKIIIKVLELFECRPGDLYMTDNRNIVRFAYS